MFSMILPPHPGTVTLFVACGILLKLISPTNGEVEFCKSVSSLYFILQLHENLPDVTLHFFLIYEYVERGKTCKYTVIHHLNFYSIMNQIKML
jgi:hypothetical protein